MTETEALETHLQELRRGTVVLACLRLLVQPGYGYGLLEELNTKPRTSYLAVVRNPNTELEPAVAAGAKESEG